MSQLHVFSSVQSLQRGAPVLAHLSAEDAVLLRADALYQLLSTVEFGAGSYAMEADARARGIDPTQFTHVEWIDYAKWVALCVEHESSISW